MSWAPSSLAARTTARASAPPPPEEAAAPAEPAPPPDDEHGLVLQRSGHDGHAAPSRRLTHRPDESHRGAGAVAVRCGRERTWGSLPPPGPAVPDRGARRAARRRGRWPRR